MYRQVTSNCCFMSDLFHVKYKAVMFIPSLGSVFVCTDSATEKGKYVYYSLCPPEDIDILGNVPSLFDVLTPKLECNQAAYY